MLRRMSGTFAAAFDRGEHRILDELIAHHSGLKIFQGSFVGGSSSKVTLPGFPLTISTLFILIGSTISRVCGSIDTPPRGLLVPFQLESHFNSAGPSAPGPSSLTAA